MHEGIARRMNEETNLGTPELERDQEGLIFGQGEVPLITYAVIGICSLLWLFLNFATAFSHYDSIYEVLAPSAYRIWTGSFWGLLTSSFVHFEIWHILFNMWWAKDFGQVMERDMGRWKYLMFIVFSAIVASGFQLLSSNQTGIGFSGVVYAMFGFCMVSHQVRPEYKKCVDAKTVQWLLGWLVLCIILSVLDVWNVANAAHIGGFLVGCLVGMAFVVRTRVVLCKMLLSLLALAAILSITYMPWSEVWQTRKMVIEAWEIRESAEAGDAIDQYIYGAMLMAYDETPEEGIAWLKRSLDQGNVDAMNSLAWYLATDPNDNARNGEEAIKLATRACEQDNWRSSVYIDTLAAAYAEVDRWEDAVSMQKRAIQAVKEDDPEEDSYYSRLQKYQSKEKIRKESYD